MNAVQNFVSSECSRRGTRNRRTIVIEMSEMVLSGPCTRCSQEKRVNVGVIKWNEGRGNSKKLWQNYPDSGVLTVVQQLSVTTLRMILRFLSSIVFRHLHCCAGGSREKIWFNSRHVRRWQPSLRSGQARGMRERGGQRDSQKPVKTQPNPSMNWCGFVLSTVYKKIIPATVNFNSVVINPVCQIRASVWQQTIN